MPTQENGEHCSQESDIAATRQRAQQHLEATRDRTSQENSTSPEKVPSAKNSLIIIKSPSMDVATDPEPDIHRRQASVCHVRSKCRCSNILQFTFRRAVSCVLHRPPSQVIHCIVLSFFSSIILLCIEKKIYKKIRKKI